VDRDFLLRTTGDLGATGRAGKAADTPTRPNTQQQGVVLDATATQAQANFAATPRRAASQARQTHPALPFYGHFDVTSAWDFDHPAVDTTAYSPQLGFSRFRMAYVPFTTEEPRSGTSGLRVKPNGEEDEHAPVGNVSHGEFTLEGSLAKKFASLKVGDTVEIKAIADWAAKLHPRGVQDLKPLLVLCQGLLRGILDEKYSFYCEEILLLRDNLKTTQEMWKAEVAEMNEAIASLETEISQQEVKTNVMQRFKTVMHRIKDSQAEADRKEHDEKVKDMLAQKEQNRMKLEAMYQEAAAELEKSKRTIERLEHEVEAMAEEGDVLKSKIKATDHGARMDQRKLHAAQGLIKRLQENLRNKARFMNMAFHDSRIEQSLQGLMEGTEDPREISKWMQRNGVLASAQLLNLLKSDQAYHTVTELPKDFAAGVMSEATVASITRMIEFAAGSGPAGADLAQSLADIMKDMSPARVAAVMADLSAEIFDQVSDHFAFAIEEQAKKRGKGKSVGFALGVDFPDEDDSQSNMSAGDLKRMVTEARDVRVLLKSTTAAWEDLEEVMADDNYGMAEGDELTKDGNAPKVQKAMNMVGAAAKRAADRMNSIAPEVIAEMLSNVEGGVADAIMDHMETQVAAKVMESLAGRAVETQALKIKEGDEVDKLLGAIERVSKSRTHLELTERLKYVQHLMMHIHGIGFTLRQLVDDSGDPEDVNLESDEAPEQSLMLMLKMDTLSSNEPHVTSIGEAGAQDLLREIELKNNAPDAGAPPEGAEEETAEEGIAAAMAADMGGDGIEMSEAERTLARRNMENLAVCQVATLQHEQPVVTRAHMAAPVFIKQDGKEFVFGTVSTSQGAHTMCPLCKRGSETHELTPQSIQHMMLIAKAIGEGVSTVAEEERISVEKVEKLLEEADGPLDVAIPGEAEKRSQFKETLQIIALRITQKMRTSDILRKQLGEIKSYAKPPKQVVQVILCTFMLLGYPGVDRYLGKEYALPQDYRALWAFLRKGISLEKPSPKYLPPRMSRLAEVLPKVPLPEWQYAGSNKALEDITHIDAKQGSHATALLRKWCLSMINLHRILYVEPAAE